MNIIIVECVVLVVAIVMVIVDMIENIHMDDLSILAIGIGAIDIFASLITMGCFIGNNKDLMAYKEQRVMIEQVLQSNKDNANIGINAQIIEYNSWLARAKSSKEYYGNWSLYYFCDIDNMEYLVYTD